MKIFISWSGKVSFEIAEILNSWIPIVIQSITTFYSPEGIEKGKKWFLDISNELENTNFGIICLTPDNLKSEWIMFEAGALSKSIKDSSVSPILFNVTPEQIQGPLSQFQATKFQKTDFRKLLITINKLLPVDKTLEQKVLDKIFDKFWDELKVDIEKVLEKYSAVPEKKDVKLSTEELLQQILELQKRPKTRISDYSDNFDKSILFLVEQFTYHFTEEEFLLDTLETEDMERYLFNPIIDLIDLTHFNEGKKNELKNSLNKVKIHIDNLFEKGAIEDNK